MNQNKISSRVWTIVKSAVATATLPVIFIYIMIAKPDYKIMNAMAHIVLPVAECVGDAVTWPVRIIGRGIDNIHELATLQSENERLRTQLDIALTNKNLCDVAIAENQRLAQELDVVSTQPSGAIMANVRHDNTAMHHSTFLVTRGTRDGVTNGMVVVSPDKQLVGIIIDAGANFSRVRALTDSDTNIAVNIAGSDVYGFLHGNGTNTPTIGFFSDSCFQISGGEKLISSNISGVLPTGLLVGEMINDKDVRVVLPGKLSRVMILKFESMDGYK